MRAALSLSWMPLLLAAGSAAFGAGSDTSAERLPIVGSGAELSADDWRGIRAAFEAERHEIRPVEDGHRARNPRQRWGLRFDARGFVVEPDAGAWSFGLELLRYGWGDVRVELSTPRCTTSEGGRLVREWDGRLEEWYVNDARGLEHGFTVRERDERARGPLVLELALRGGLRAVVEEGARDLRFEDESGRVVLTYAGLTVFDADGRRCRASFELEQERLVLRVQERDARYPLTIDPLLQESYLKASKPDAFDTFGWRVAMSGDTVVVTAPLEDSRATGVGGFQGDNGAPDSGAAYVFAHDGTTWSQEAYLKATNTGAGDSFGWSVAICGDTIVVGAPYEDSGAMGVNGDGADDSRKASGAAYVYVRDGSTWSRQAYLKASNTGGAPPGEEEGDLFGWSVAVSGDTIVIGAPAESSNATGVDGDQSNDSATRAGAVYAFVRQGTSWSQQAYLKASNSLSGYNFGTSVGLHGDTLIVGAPGEGSAATGVDGDQNDNSLPGAGAAYVFERSGPTWSQRAYLKASNTGAEDRFGVSLALSGDTAVVGADQEDSSSTGVDGDQGNDDAPVSGAAYVFTRSGPTWSQQAYLKASNPGAQDRFGRQVAISGETIVVGAALEDSAATGVDPDPNDAATNAGAAYVFVRAGSSWSQEAFLKASNAEANDGFGVSVAVSADRIVVGANGEDSNATGVDGNPSNNWRQSSGAAYGFRLLPEPVAWCFGDGSGPSCPCGNTGGPGRGCANSVGAGALLSAGGSSSIGAQDLVLLASGLVPGQPCLFFQGEGSSPGLPFGDGLRCAAGPLVRLETRIADGAGASATTIDIAQAGGVAPGDTRHYQLHYRDPAGPCSSGFNLSNAIRAVWGE